MILPICRFVFLSSIEQGISAARIKSIVKDDIEVKSITTEACFIIGRALVSALPEIIS